MQIEYKQYFYITENLPMKYPIQMALQEEIILLNIHAVNIL